MFLHLIQALNQGAEFQLKNLESEWTMLCAQPGPSMPIPQQCTHICVHAQNSVKDL